ncbi:ZIP family metal transporter [Proteiniclasticum sp. BAD-10]|uniref:ZIP family metal transporter n=1 Tax=Proteiniclasticum sediminis TaxID=2804028 RepID=A0A941CNM1_9CLOT|nr:ZIP family metal transporter [Proteiniclasticum sediminis]MBR0575372.1 ZIP family metal transporter [Proteiniclasticum sediminis]
MIEFIRGYDATVQALFATLFTWGVTALGSALVFFFKSINKKVFDTMLGFAAGVMIAASFWSLISPGLELATEMGYNAWAMAAFGFMSGGLFLFLVDKTLPHMHLGLAPSEQEGPKTSWQRSVLLVTAITLHNIPEGLAVGVAFGAVAAGIESASLTSAIALAIGIGLQNFPEGAAVSIPLRREGMSRGKAFLYGQASGIVEPIAGVLGALLVLSVRSMLPFALCFAAGAMIYVVVEELIPEAQSNNNSDYATMGVLVGFTIMMILDVALG